MTIAQTCNFDFFFIIIIIIIIVFFRENMTWYFM